MAAPTLKNLIARIRALEKAAVGLLAQGKAEAKGKTKASAKSRAEAPAKSKAEAPTKSKAKSPSKSKRPRESLRLRPTRRLRPVQYSSPPSNQFRRSTPRSRHRPANRPPHAPEVGPEARLPDVAPKYSAESNALAKQISLGRKRPRHRLPSRNRSQGAGARPRTDHGFGPNQRSFVAMPTRSR